MFELSQLEEIYGPAAPCSEHKLGERVTYSLGKDIFTGTSAWCTAPQVRKGKQLPILYIIARDQAENASLTWFVLAALSPQIDFSLSLSF